MIYLCLKRCREFYRHLSVKKACVLYLFTKVINGSAHGFYLLVIYDLCYEVRAHSVLTCVKGDSYCTATDSAIVLFLMAGL